MKKIVYTQRVDVIEDYNERRDCTDQEVSNFIWECGYIPVAVNNHPERVKSFMEEIKACGIVLTGGNNLSKYEGNAPERDETERKLIAYGIENDIPIYGFCRGMQIIADYFGLELVKINNHVAVRHVLTDSELWNDREVNSFHNMAVKEIKPPLIVIARSKDGSIEAIRHKEKNIYASMWHPERENPYAQEDITFVRKIFL